VKVFLHFKLHTVNTTQTYAATVGSSEKHTALGRRDNQAFTSIIFELLHLRTTTSMGK